jgi:Mrp family chromosome partitioning ATPase
MDPRCEEYRRIRTALQRMTPTPRVLVFAGFGDGAGSAGLTANLAAAFVEAGTRVTVVDADLKAPRMHTLLAGRAGPGLAEAMQGARPEVQESGVAGAKLLAAGGADISAVPALKPPLCKELWSQLAAETDLILVNAPSFEVSADAEALAADADGMVLVLRIGRDARARTDELIQRLQRSGVRVVGAIATSAS